MNSWKQIVKGMVLVLAVITILSFKAGASTQATTPSSSDPLSALLSEMHALRIAMEQQATISPRIQISMARLNIEEQRMAQLTQQLDQIHRQLTDVVLESQKIAEHLSEMDKSALTEKDQKIRDEIEQQQKEFKRRQNTQSAIEQQLRIRESDIARELDTEQARWTDLNSRIDELESLLSPARKPE